MDRLRFLSIGSGSSGNCYYIGTGEYGFLIDAGISVRTIKHVLKENNLDFEKIWGIFVTHDHTDHIKSVGVLGEKYHIPVYVTQEMRDGINRNYKVTDKLVSCCKYFHKGELINVKDFTFQAFPVSHDATDCVGYSIKYRDQRFVIATDLGFISKEVADQIAKANYLVIEANYDEDMLQYGSYSYPLKQRVKSYLGHLSNIHTANFLADNWHDGLQYVFLCHLSQDNNTREIAYDTVNNALQAKGICPKLLYALQRTVPSQLYIFDSPTKVQ